MKAAEEEGGLSDHHIDVLDIIFFSRTAKSPPTSGIKLLHKGSELYDLCYQWLHWSQDQSYVLHSQILMLSFFYEKKERKKETD